MTEKEHDDGDYKEGKLGIWQSRNMMMENIRLETWEYGRVGT